MQNHFLLRVGNGEHFRASSAKHIWGIVSNTPAGKGFLGLVKKGDLLWFVQSDSNGLIIAVATYRGHRARELTNGELGWTATEGDWDVELLYESLYNLSHCGLESRIVGPLVIRLYNEKCLVNLPAEYPAIARYAKVSASL